MSGDYVRIMRLVVYVFVCMPASVYLCVYVKLNSHTTGPISLLFALSFNTMCILQKTETVLYKNTLHTSI